MWSISFFLFLWFWIEKTYLRLVFILKINEALKKLIIGKYYFKYYIYTFDVCSAFYIDYWWIKLYLYIIKKERYSYWLSRIFLKMSLIISKRWRFEYFPRFKCYENVRFSYRLSELKHRKILIDKDSICVRINLILQDMTHQNRIEVW